jgi:hypothetical protein
MEDERPDVQPDAYTVAACPLTAFAGKKVHISDFVQFKQAGYGELGFYGRVVCIIAPQPLATLDVCELQVQVFERVPEDVREDIRVKPKLPPVLEFFETDEICTIPALDVRGRFECMHVDRHQNTREYISDNITDEGVSRGAVYYTWQSVAKRAQYVDIVGARNTMEADEAEQVLVPSADPEFAMRWLHFSPDHQDDPFYMDVKRACFDGYISPLTKPAVPSVSGTALPSDGRPKRKIMNPSTIAMYKNPRSWNAIQKGNVHEAKSILSRDSRGERVYYIKAVDYTHADVVTAREMSKLSFPSSVIAFWLAGRASQVEANNDHNAALVGAAEASDSGESDGDAAGQLLHPSDEEEEEEGEEDLTEGDTLLARADAMDQGDTDTDSDDMDADDSDDGSDDGSYHPPVKKRKLLVEE